MKDTNQLLCVGEEVLELNSQKLSGFVKLPEASGHRVAALDILIRLAVIFFTLDVFLTSA